MIRRHGSPAGIAERSGLTEEELLRAADAADRRGGAQREDPRDVKEGGRP
jgi:hypothetical protein